MPRLDPAVYPHLSIYPPIAGVSKPPPQTLASPTLNSTKATGIHLASGYPSLVICKSSYCGRESVLTHDLIADPPVYPWIDVYPSAAGEVSKPLPLPSSRQPRTRLALHTRPKSRKRFTASEDAPPVPKLPDYVILQGLSPTSPHSPRQGQKRSLQEPLAYPVMSICD